MIPCKSYKCIVFPACKSKRIIYCRPLLQYIKLLKEKEATGPVWSIISEDLPNVTTVRDDNEEWYV